MYKRTIKMQLRWEGNKEEELTVFSISVIDGQSSYG